VPGLWVPAAVMAVLAARLARHGYVTRSFGYHGRAPLEANIARLARFVDGRTAHFVGHSLGSVLIYDMLVRHGGIASGNVVLLGAPVRGCYAGRWEAHEARWQRRETTVEGMSDRALVRTGHSMLTVSRRVGA